MHHLYSVLSSMFVIFSKKNKVKSLDRILKCIGSSVCLFEKPLVEKLLGFLWTFVNPVIFT